MALEQRDKEFVLAIDPALSTTGYAVIGIDDYELAYINKFTTSPKNSEDFRINEILVKLFSVVAQYPINNIVLEDGFLGVNARTSIQLATLRGAIIGMFNFNKYKVNHMLTSEIRKELGLKGNAKKEDVALFISNMYKNSKKIEIIGPYSDKQNKSKTSDMYDALGTGVAFIKRRKRILNGS